MIGLTCGIFPVVISFSCVTSYLIDMLFLGGSLSPVMVSLDCDVFEENDLIVIVRFYCVS